MLENGRINISGLDLTNIDGFIECVKKFRINLLDYQLIIELDLK